MKYFIIIYLKLKILHRKNVVFFLFRKKNSKQQMLPNKTFKQQQQQDRKLIISRSYRLKKKQYIHQTYNKHVVEYLHFPYVSTEPI